MFCGSYIDLQAGMYLKSFLNTFGSSNVFLMDNIFLDIMDHRFFFQLNTTIEELELMFNVLFLGLNLRLEIPLLNSRLRKAFLTYDYFKAYSIGGSLNFLTYPVQNITITLEIFYIFMKVNLGLVLVYFYQIFIIYIFLINLLIFLMFL